VTEEFSSRGYRERLGAATGSLPDQQLITMDEEHLMFIDVGDRCMQWFEQDTILTWCIGGRLGIGHNPPELRSRNFEIC